jgi:uncharacterized repeat protein (TIGR03803 family)
MKCFPRRPVLLLAAAFTALTATAFATGPQQHLLYTFPGQPNGAGPTSTLIADAAGNLYGTTSVGGTSANCIFSGGANVGCGAVFELSPPASGIGNWTETVLYSFQDLSDGAVPYGGLVIDTAGNLYGTAQIGGTGLAELYGTIYELSPPVSGGAWTFTKLYTFQPSPGDGNFPMGTLVFDHSGNLYGTTQGGGTSNGGTVFKLSPPSSSGGSWTETVLHSFSGSDGFAPVAGLYMDGAGNLYGTTVQGGNMADCSGSGCGVVFKLSPGTGGTWTELLLHRFTRTDGSNPYGSLIFYHGNFYGTTSASYPAGGSVFELTPGHGGPWTLTTIHFFNGPIDGQFPYSEVTVDAAGNLYGTTYNGGFSSAPYGTVYKLVPASGGVWTETVLANFSFPGTGEYGPIGGLLVRGNKLFGTTSDCWGGFFAACSTAGHVFAITNF